LDTEEVVMGSTRKAQANRQEFHKMEPSTFTATHAVHCDLFNRQLKNDCCVHVETVDGCTTYAVFRGYSKCAE
jgi:hypothetical protein